jgi:hypothetical protein
MAADSMFTLGGVTLVRPVNNTGNTNYFALQTPGITPATERLQRFLYPGVDGQALKKLGATPQSGRIQGFVDASSLANLQTGRAALDALCKGQTPGTATFYNGNITINNVIVNAVTWGEFWGYAGRVCANFELAWESTG